MKYLMSLLLAGTCLPASSQNHANNRFLLSGKVTNLQQGRVYLRYVNYKQEAVLDSAELHNGAFQLKGQINGPVMASFYGLMKSRGMDDPNYTSLFLEPGTMQVSVADQAFKSAVVTGSATQSEYTALNAQQQVIEKRWKVVMDTLHEVNKRSNFAYQELKNWVLVPYYEERQQLQAAFIKAHPASYVTAYLLRYNRELSTDSLRKWYEAFPPKLKQSCYGKDISEELQKRKIGIPGTMAADFAAANIHGATLQLADYRGKYVLLDFWASWCLPCRKGNPHLKELYDIYKDKGFEVIGVSDDDRDTTAWKKAVAKDDLPWQQVLRGMKMNMVGDRPNFDRSHDISDKYNISSLPTQILIDPKGMIIGRYGEGAEAHTALDDKLRSLFLSSRPFTINGSYTKPGSDTLYLAYPGNNGKYVKDSAIVNNGSFSFRGTLAEPVMAYLQVGREDRENSSVQLFLEPTAMQLQLGSQPEDAVLTGSATHNTWTKMKASKAAIRKEMEPLRTRYTAANTAYIAARKNHAPDTEQDTLKYRAAAIHDEFDPYNERIKLEDLKFFTTHPTSIVTAFALRFYFTSMTADTLRRWYNSLGAATQQTSYGKLVAEELSRKFAGAPGSMAKDFTAKELTGQPLQLSAFKGKYVILDFWASWCIPCRKGNPHLKELYSHYKSKGLDVIGISDDDRDSTAWHKAVNKDGLPWHHVLRGLRYNELKGYDKSNDISDGFAIHTLPTKILIDPTGKIIGRYGSDGEEDAALDATLQALLP